MTVLLEAPWIDSLVAPGGDAGSDAYVAVRERPGPQPEAAGIEPTLETAVLGVWEALTAHRVGECLVCGGSMAPRYGAAGRPLGGRCTDCGSTLA